MGKISGKTGRDPRSQIREKAVKLRLGKTHLLGRYEALKGGGGVGSVAL